MREALAQVLASDTIRYSQVWEDHLLLERGLRIASQDHVVSVTSGGDNVLALLLQEPRRVTAIDINPAQSAVLELKLAGIRRLSHAQFVALLGLSDAFESLALYETLRSALPSEAQNYWDAHPADLQDGLLHRGRLEQYMLRFQRDYAAQCIAARDIDAMLALDDAPAQRRHFNRSFDRAAYRELFEWYFGREMLARHGRHVEQMRFVGEMDVGAYFWERFEDVCTRLPTRRNFYLEYFLRGTYRDLEHGPLYLRRASFEQLKGLVRRVVVETTELTEWLHAQVPGSVHKANLSDVFEYLPEYESLALYDGFVGAAANHARICYWNLLVPRSAPAALRRHIHAHNDEAVALWRADRSWIYRAFHIEEVVVP